MPALAAAVIDRILAAIPHRRIGLVGDLFLDRYLDIDPALDEPSVETGLTAYQVARVRNYPGALGTVLNNLAALGVGAIHPITLIGEDGEGYDLRWELKKLPAVDATGVIVTTERRTPTYTKPMYGVRELNRLDIKNRTRTSAHLEDAIISRLEADWPTFDAVIVLDQVSEEDCGVVTARVRDRIAELAGGSPQKFVLADSRERILLFRNACLKPNEDESRKLAGAGPVSRSVFRTAGEKGMILTLPTGETVAIPGYPVAGPTDICGAGDSCSAGIAAAMATGATEVEAAMFGNLVASITVQQIGVTGTATPEQVRARWREVAGGSG